MARKRSDIRERILESARECFLGKGADGASLRRIARGARTNVGMVYYYFGTKDELFFEVIETTYAAMLADLNELLEHGTPLQERLVALSRRVGDMSDEELQIVRIVTREMLASGERRTRILKRFQQGHVGMIVRVLQEAVTSGELEHATPETVVALVGATAFPQFIRRLIGEESGFLASLLPDAERLAEGLVRIFLDGARANP